MSVELVILGLLSFRPMAGYDIKKIFENSPAFYWSGNNNQVYTTLVALHKKGWVSCQVQPQDFHPPRKVYAITENGKRELDAWLRAAPELPRLRHPFLIQLAWSAGLQPAELDVLLQKYADEVWMELLILRRRTEGSPSPESHFPLPGMDPSLARTPREAHLWGSLQSYWISYFENEFAWVQKLSDELKKD